MRFSFFHFEKIAQLGRSEGDENHHGGETITAIWFISREGNNLTLLMIISMLAPKSR
jgi:hypothetical protein